MFIICRPTRTIARAPFTPTISAVSTPIHAPKRFTRDDEEVRQDRREDHVPHDLPPARVEDPRGVDVVLLHVLHAVDRSELEHEEDADEDHEDRGAVPDAERNERERNPGHGGDGRQQRDHGVRQLVEDAQRERQAADEHGSHERQRQPAHDAHQAGPDRREGDEVSADSPDADLRQEELRLVLDLGDEDAGGEGSPG